jgi:hypothetical protein
MTVPLTILHVKLTTGLTTYFQTDGLGMEV